MLYFVTRVYLSLYVSLSIHLSLSLYIYIYIYTHINYYENVDCLRQDGSGTHHAPDGREKLGGCLGGGGPPEGGRGETPFSM